MKLLAHGLMQPIRRFDDADTFLMIWSGGFQAAEANRDQWRILPVLREGRPHVNGYYSKSELGHLMHQYGLKFVAFHHMQWRGGEYFPHWVPNIPGQANFAFSPADSWSNAASNLGRERLRAFGDFEEVGVDEIEQILDAHTEPERLARSIALSLRNLDTSVGEIASFYHEELNNMLASGRIDGTRVSTLRDQALYAAVHSFFLHLGSARDYLAAFTALSLGKDHHRYDAMNRLTDVIRTSDFDKSPLLTLMARAGYLSPKENTSEKWTLSGWLKDASDLRNEFVHKRSYGQRNAEQMGSLVPIDISQGIYRYFRPIFLADATKDVLDIVISHYEKMNELFFAAARVAKIDLSMMEITDADIISSEEAS